MCREVERGKGERRKRREWNEMVRRRDDEKGWCGDGLYMYVCVYVRVDVCYLLLKTAVDSTNKLTTIRPA